jgi:hypothetical protein
MATGFADVRQLEKLFVEKLAEKFPLNERYDVCTVYGLGGERPKLKHCAGLCRLPFSILGVSRMHFQSFTRIPVGCWGYQVRFVRLLFSYSLIHAVQ